MVSNALSVDVKILEELFQKFNNKYFKNTLPTPTITIQTRGKNKAYGWITVSDLWITKEQTKHKEINLSAEYMNRSFNEIAATLLHEMVHLKNIEDKIQDCSRGGTYHNVKFKEAAEKIGLEVTAEPKYGYCRTVIKPNTDIAKYLTSIKNDYNFKYRIDVNNIDNKAKKKGNSIKYVCPCCGISIRATKYVNIACVDCSEIMEIEY